jgi:hypothetical protein
MVDHAQRYPSYDPNVEPCEERPTSHPAAPYQPVAHYQRPARTNFGEVPLFLSDATGEPDPSEFAQALAPKPRSFTMGVLLGVTALTTLGLLAALVSSDTARDIIRNAQASTTAVLSAASAAVQPSSTRPRTSDGQIKPPDVPLKETTRLPAPETQMPTAKSATASVAVAAVVPTPEDIKTAYQGALQDSAPPPAAPPAVAPETVTPPADTIHRLEASEIASLIQRANALIATGDIAAARLVLRRAAEAGDGRAAMTLGGTYDPAVLEKLGVHGVVPDLAMARSWYEKAKRFGAQDAITQLELLANRQH